MKTVLWVARHQMTAEQFHDLERIQGEPICLSPWKNTVQRIGELLPHIAQADAVAAVLPPELLMELLHSAGGKPVLQAVSKRVPTGRIITLADGRTEPEFAFVHGGWKQILRLEMETRML